MKYIICLATAYLTKSIEDWEMTRSPEQIRTQMEKFKLTTENLKDVNVLETEKGGLVYLTKLEAPKQNFFGDINQEIIDNDLRSIPNYADLVIAGSDQASEKLVSDFRIHSRNIGLRVPIARYSTFYGKPSGYSEMLPEDTGYSLDIPKDIQTIRALITNDSVLEALSSKDENRIRGSLEELNALLERPILVTPFLHEALQHRRPGSY
ncbi:MAG: hypothetical protein Q8Q31_05260 [Nanoarchaeota archaeon]|nr:hypothetical protein [Nanoarchaeota archaeon]